MYYLFLKIKNVLMILRIKICMSRAMKYHGNVIIYYYILKIISLFLLKAIRHM